MITFSEQRDISIEQILPIYQANKWSSARKPRILHQALLNSHSLMSAWDYEQLVVIGNVILDGFLFVYYPHLLVHTDYQGEGIGNRMDHLLPRLMSGKLEVEDLDIAFPPGMMEEDNVKS